MHTISELIAATSCDDIQQQDETDSCQQGEGQLDTYLIRWRLRAVQRHDKCKYDRENNGQLHGIKTIVG
jgi:hypothetical protein